MEIRISEHYSVYASYDAKFTSMETLLGDPLHPPTADNNDLILPQMAYRIPSRRKLRFPRHLRNFLSYTCSISSAPALVGPRHALNHARSYDDRIHPRE